MTRLAISVSSSIVMNITPLADPGFCRTRTIPATVTPAAIPSSSDRRAAMNSPAPLELGPEERNRMLPKVRPLDR